MINACLHLIVRPDKLAKVERHLCATSEPNPQCLPSSKHCPHQLLECPQYPPRIHTIFKRVQRVAPSQLQVATPTLQRLFGQQWPPCLGNGGHSGKPATKAWQWHQKICRSSSCPGAAWWIAAHGHTPTRTLLSESATPEIGPAAKVMSDMHTRPGMLHNLSLTWKVCSVAKACVAFD